MGMYGLTSEIVSARDIGAARMGVGEFCGARERAEREAAAALAALAMSAARRSK